MKRFTQGHQMIMVAIIHWTTNRDLLMKFDLNKLIIIPKMFSCQYCWILWHKMIFLIFVSLCVLAGDFVYFFCFISFSLCLCCCMYCCTDWPLLLSDVLMGLFNADWHLFFYLPEANGFTKANMMGKVKQDWCSKSENRSKSYKFWYLSLICAIL